MSGSSSLPSSVSDSEQQPAIPPVNSEANPLPTSTPLHEQPKPVRTLSRSATVTKKASAAATPAPSVALES